VRNHEVPWIGLDKRRLEVEALGSDCWQVVVHYGFKNDPDLPKALELLSGRGIRLEPDDDQLLPVARHRHAHPGLRHAQFTQHGVGIVTQLRR
jgi:K+ transporter